MVVFEHTEELFVRAELTEVWEFFSHPANLRHITPPDMNFKILTEVDGVKAYAGQIIRYTVAPLWGIRLGWTTEITHCIDQQYFVDEQRSGPFAFWHHQHFFKPVSGGVMLRDVVHYALPLGPIGLIAKPIVGPRVRAIFEFRKKAIAARFG